MLSLRVSGMVAALLMTIGATAQDQYYIVPDSVPLAVRNVWCNDQTTTCPLLCLQYGDSQTTNSNECDAELLTYSCECANGISPNMTEYSVTLPFHICQTWGQQCIAGCGGVNTCQAACTEQHPCGAQDPTRVNSTSTSSSATATKTSTSTSTGTGSSQAEETGDAPVVYSGFGTSAPAAAAAAPTTTPNAAQAAIDLGGSYGLPAVFAGLFAVFGLLM